MSTRTIASPGVQINEVDLSLITRPEGISNVFVTGFAKQGPTDEIINVTSVSEYEEIFGKPENSAERYLYHSSKEILNKAGNLMVSRMPYGSGAGIGFSNYYSALVYPIEADATNYVDGEEFLLGSPTSLLLTKEQYDQILMGDISWNPASTNAAITTFDLIGNAGLVVLNTSKTVVNDLYEGYYLGIADNSNINPSTDFNAINDIMAVNGLANKTQTFTAVPSSRLTFTLTAPFSSYGSNSMSEVIESQPNQYDFGSNSYNDSLIFGLFKVRTSIYNQDTVMLDYVLSEGYTGSLSDLRFQNDVNGGTPKTFSIQKTVNSYSPNIKVVINPYIAECTGWVGTDGLPKKTIRVTPSAKKAYALGTYTPVGDRTTKEVGNVPLKLERVLRLLEIQDDIQVDIIPEAGLGTVWTGAFERSKIFPTDPIIFDDTFPVDISNLYTNDNSIVTGGGRESYLDIVNQFVNFAQKVRKDHIFLADGLRYIYVNGKDFKTTKKEGYIFSNHIYWPLKNLFATVETSYAAVYGNWLKLADTYSDSQVWIPSSGFVAGNMVENDRFSYPWAAPAGFSKGSLTGVIDIGTITNQKQRDLLYKISVNPIAFFPSDGFVIYGQKTLYKKPSAFDRINVRRLFLYLEKNTKSLLKYFLFEPNAFSTRTRLVASLSPLFDQAKVNDGIYAYQIVCDERNNTPDVIDNNELKLSIYIQPVRTAEYILADFIATRTGVDFNELIG